MLGSEVSVDGLWEAAHRAEAYFHGTPSGIDTGLAVLDGLYAFAPVPPDLPGARRLDGFPLHLVIGAVPRAGSTRGLVAGLRERVESGDIDTKEAIERLGEFSARAIGLLAGGDPANLPELGRLADAAQGELAGLGLSTDHVDSLLRLGRESGAVGGKLSGAGGGGAFYLLFKDAESADAAHRSLVAAHTENGSGEVPLFRFSWLPE
jgi:mevalonate kinase